jgi:hypothetical protein
MGYKLQKCTKRLGKARRPFKKLSTTFVAIIRDMVKYLNIPGLEPILINACLKFGKQTLNTPFYYYYLFYKIRYYYSQCLHVCDNACE